jgi:hypothetical protein
MSKERYIITFDFDSKGDPPKVEIYDTRDEGTIVEVFEEPTCTAGEWSWDGADWKPGPLAAALLALMNAADLPDAQAPSGLY